MKRSVAFAFAGIGVLVGCESIIDAEFDVTREPCTHRQPPGPPSSVVNGGGEGEAWAVVYGVDVGDRIPPVIGPHAQIGFDLDKNCANKGQRPACTMAPWARPNSTDGTDGIDNGAGAMMQAETELFGSADFTSATITNRIKSGEHAALAIVRVRNYNLFAEDDSVELDWYVPEARGGVPTFDGGLPVLEGGVPTLDGTDVWPIWDQSVSDPLVPGAPFPSSRYRTTGYVTALTLVATLPPGTPIRLQSVLFATEGLTVALQLRFSPFRIDGGTIGGLVRASELFSKMPRMTKAFEIGAVCRSSKNFPLVQGYFCRFIDARADGQVAPDKPCDAISLGIRIETAGVKPGALLPESMADLCPNDSPVDDCAKPAP